jgi:hypothetical protein
MHRPVLLLVLWDQIQRVLCLQPMQAGVDFLRRFPVDFLSEDMPMNGKNIWGLLFAGISAIAGVIVIVNMGKTQGTTTNVFPPLNTPDATPSIASTADTQTAAQPDVTTSTQGVSKLPVQPVYVV